MYKEGIKENILIFSPPTCLYVKKIPIIRPKLPHLAVLVCLKNKKALVNMAFLTVLFQCGSGEETSHTIGQEYRIYSN